MDGKMRVRWSYGQANIGTKKCFIEYIFTTILPTKRIKVTTPFPRLLI